LEPARQLPSDDVLRDEIRHRTRAVSIDAAARIMQSAFKYGAWIAVTYLIVGCVKDIAGTSTDFRFLVKGVLSLNADRWFAYIVAILTSGGYILERKLRRRVTRERDGYIKELETRIDPNRSSSRLEPDGRPPRELDGPPSRRE
jgi:hypothetical protein